ncbi:MAG TPA: iron ABC transporter permease [Burkholderiales bacterium]|nr:iron ABC transporter permease [Burkholderiales bacterium]
MISGSRNFARLYCGALGLTLALVLLAFWLGKFPLSSADVLAAVAAKLFGVPVHLPVNAEAVMWEIRAPRIGAALLVGAGLAAAGSSYQGMFKNPLVSPDILGVSSGAALGAVLGIFLSKNIVMIQLFAFMGGLIAVGLVYAVGSAVRGHDPLVTLILTGVVIGTLLGSFIALLKYLADPYNQLPAITFWLMGSLASIASSDLVVAAPLIALGLIPLYLLRWRINLLSLSDDEAQALGVNLTATRLIVIFSATLMTAASVAIAGIIGWIGLLMPHIARMLVGPDFAKALPMSLLLGAAFMLGVDTLARTAADIEIPPGVLTALIGTPFFIWILSTARRGWR